MLTANLHSRQVKTLARYQPSRAFRVQFCCTLTVDQLCSRLFLWGRAFWSMRHTGYVTADEKCNRSVLLRFQGDVYHDGVYRIADQRTHPHDMVEAYLWGCGLCTLCHRSLTSESESG